MGTVDPREHYTPPPGYNQNPPPPPGSNYTGPGSQYGYPAPNGWTLRPGASENFARDNQIDPNTGMFYPGQPGGLVPHPLGLQYQALSDQGIWRLRQSYMRSGINYARGALGLLQSFRPGGGAAIEAGIYQGLAGLEFNRAQMTEPLDLLADYREEKDFEARRSSRKQQDRALAVQIAATVAGFAVGGPFGAAAGAAAAGAASGGGGQQSQGWGAGAESSSPNAGWGAGTGGGTTFNTGAGATGSSAGAAGGGGWGAAGAAPSGAAQATLGEPGLSQEQGPGAQMPGQPGQQPGQGGQPRGRKQVQQGGAGAMAGGQPTVGMDGNFTPVAYAASAASALPNPIQQLALNRSAADMIDSDPFYMTFSAAVNARWRQRLVA